MQTSKVTKESIPGRHDFPELCGREEISVKFGAGRRSRRRGRHRVLARWTPRALVRRSLVRLTKWELHLMAWGVRMTFRRAFHAVLPTAVRHKM